MIASVDGDQPLLSFHGPIRVSELRRSDGLRQYLVTPLSDAAVLEELCAGRERAAWYAGVREAFQAVLNCDVSVPADARSQLLAVLMALRHPRDANV